jgi:F-type H+-transporting ATPase subunit epsilon
MGLTLEIVTPERSVFSDTVDHVILPTKDGGEIDVLPGHVPLMAMLEPGELKFFKNGSPDSVAIDRGFIELLNDTVRVLTEAAIEVDKIDVSALAEARQRAEAALAEAKASGEDPEVLEQLETKARFTVVQQLVREQRR